MAVTRADRRRQRQDVVLETFEPSHAEIVLDLLELMEFAWHDCYGEVSPDDSVIADVLLVSDGSIEGLIRPVRLAVIDRRDLQVAAEDRRSEAL